MKSLRKVSILLILDPSPSANPKNNMILGKLQKKQLLTILSGDDLWGESYSQEARCREIKLKTIVRSAFNNCFTYLSSRLSIICTSFILLCMSISLMHSYEYDISHLALAEGMFENSRDKQNNKAFEPVFSPLFQAISNAKRSYQTTQYNRASTPFSPRQLFLAKSMLVSCQSINNIAIPDRIWRKQSLPGETFRCLNPLHKESLYFKINFSGFIKYFNRYVQHPGHKLLNYLWIFLKGMNTKYLNKFDNLSII